MSRHISEQYDAELETARRRLMEMGGLVEQQLRDAMRALTARDSALIELMYFKFVIMCHFVEENLCP